MSVPTQVKLTEIRVRYLASIELACIPGLLRRGISIPKHLRCNLETTTTEKRSYQYNKSLLIATNTLTIYAKVLL